MKDEDKTGYRIFDEWNSTKDESLHITTPDGVQKLIHPDGTEEILTEDHPRYNHWAGR